MARRATGEDHIFGILHLDRLADALERLPAGRRQIFLGVFRIHALDKNVLCVRPGIGEPPGDLVVAAEEDERRSRKRGPDQIFRRVELVGYFQVGKIPDRRRHQRQMRIIGDDRLAGIGPRARHDPVVRRTLGGHAVEHRHVVPRTLKGSLLKRSAFQSQERFHVGKRRRIVDIEHRQKIVGLLTGEAQTRKGQPVRFVIDIGRQRYRHHLDRGQRVDRLPWFRLDPEDHEFGRQLGREGLRLPAHPGVDSARIAFQHVLRRLVHHGERGFCSLVDCHGAQPAIGTDGGFAKHFRQPPLPGHAIDLHLPQPLLSMNETESGGSIRAGGSLDMGNAVCIAGYRHRPRQPCDRDLAIKWRKRARQPEHACADGNDEQRHDHQQKLEQGFDDTPHWSMSPMQLT